MTRFSIELALVLAAAVPGAALAQKVMLNPSDQNNNAVSGGGVESEYALDFGNRTKPILDAAGFNVRVDQDFHNSPGNANSWGAAVFVSLHSNAGGGHGIETLTTGSTQGSLLSSRVLSGLLSKVPYQTRGVKVRNNLWVLNATNMPATLAEVVFHDCTTTSGYAGHPPSESAFLRSVSGRDQIAEGLAAGVCSYFGNPCIAPPPTKGFVKGVVFKNPDLNSHLAPATVSLNTGPSVVYDGSAEWSFEVAAGSYTVTATADGFKPGSISRTVVAGQTVYGSIGLDPVVSATTGFLKGVVYQNPNLQDVLPGASVSINPGGSTVYNGTDDWSFELAPGTYTVTAEAPGYLSATLTRTVVAGETVVSSVGLDRAPVPEGDAGPAEVADAGDPPPSEVIGPAIDGEEGIATLRGPAPAVSGGCGCATGADFALPLSAMLLAGCTRRRRSGGAGHGNLPELKSGGAL